MVKPMSGQIKRSRLVERTCQSCSVRYLSWPDELLGPGRGRFCSRTCARREQPKIPLETRFWLKVQRDDSEDGCWLWTGASNGHGYGQIWFDGKIHHASRVGYRLQVGDFAEELHILHRCDNPPCVRGSHLTPGTRADNMRDSSLKGRARGARGTAHRSAKLDEDRVREIRRRRAGGEAVKDLALSYGVSTMAIYDIVNRKKWKHVD